VHLIGLIYEKIPRTYVGSERFFLYIHNQNICVF